MEQINLKVKAEVLSGLCGELEKRQADFENYAESVLRDAIAENGGKPIKFKTTDLRDKSYSVMLRPDTFHTYNKWGCCAFIESGSGEAWYGLQEVDNKSIVEIVENVIKAVTGKE